MIDLQVLHDGTASRILQTSYSRVLRNERVYEDATRTLEQTRKAIERSRARLRECDAFMRSVRPTIS